MRLKQFLPAIIWFIISSILLAMPGDDLPDTSLFDIPFFDKFIHLGMFFLLTFLFCYPYSLYNSFSVWKFTAYKIAISAIAYGIGMEYVQKHFVAGRSFDLVDILFDSLGCGSGVAGIWIFQKKIGPDRNRGRNQN